MRFCPTAFIVLFCFSFSLLGWSQQDARKLRIDATKPIRLNYYAPSWNKKPDQIDSAIVLMRDANTGKIVRIQMQETAVNSGEFVGQFQINFKMGAPEELKSDITPEIYVPPQGMADQLTKIDSMIKEGTLFRKPYFLRMVDKIQSISIFDSRDQAYEAYSEYLKSGAGIGPINPEALKAKRNAQFEAEKRKMEADAKRAELDRLKLAESERLKQEEMKKQQGLLNEQQKALRRKQAESWAQKAMQHYGKGEYQQASDAFAKSVELDPENTRYYYQYGVTLFKISDYNKSLVILNLSNDPANQLERRYYMGQNHMRLKEYDAALIDFDAVKAANDKTLSPPAAFFAGVVQFQKEKYDDAKSDFEYVLDKSGDPKLDQQADAYIEQIANIKQFQELQKKPWSLTANVGLVYDSNITSAASGNPTDLAGWRLLYGASLDRRWIYKEKREFLTSLTVSDMYSMDTGFAAKQTFQDTDPLQASVYFPYKWRGETNGKPTQRTVSPGFETVLMNADGVGARETILNSVVMKGNETLVMSDEWFASYDIELRSDTSLLTSTAADNKSASRVTLATTQTFFKNNKKSEANIWDGTVAYNAAQGINEQYYRMDLGYGYTAPLISNMNWSARLGLGYANYPAHATGRTDTVSGLTVGLKKPLTEHWSGTVAFNYNNNGSTNASYNYNKYMLTTLLTWADIF